MLMVLSSLPATGYGGKGLPKKSAALVTLQQPPSALLTFQKEGGWQKVILELL